MSHVWIAGMSDPVMIETAWERQMQVSGLDDYENQRSKIDPSSTRAGKKLTRRMLAKAEAAIEEMQKELIKTDRVARNHKATVVGIPAETLALIALKSMIDRTYSTTAPHKGAGWQSVTKDIGKACETEMNFRHWVQSSRDAAREYAKSKGRVSVPPSIADRMLAEHGSNRAQISRWKKTITELSEYSWEIDEIHFCGDALMCAIVKALPGDFEILFEAKRNSNQKFCRMTDATRQKFDDVEYSVSATQMVRKPMLTKPRRWTAN